MRLAVLLLLALAASGCGGTLVLESRNNRVPPPPPPMPTVDCPAHEIGQQEAVALVSSEASRQRVTHTSVRKAQRLKKVWKLDLRGVTREGREARIKATVDRWSGEILDYSCKIEERGHGHDHDHGGHKHHDRDDD